MVADVFIVTHATNCDLYDFINHNSRKVIQLWHGIPIKKIGKDDKRHVEKLFKERVKYLLFPFLRAKYSLIIASSIEDQKNMSTAFNVIIDNVKVTGYPRNDIFVSESKLPNQFKVLYAPTLRDEVGSEVNLFDGYGFDIAKVLRILEANEIFLDIKMHLANKIDIKFKNSINSKYINFLESKMEINEIIKDYSIIISDYSGIYVDYLLTNRPIIFAPFDYEKYIIKDRELYYDYDEVTPGPQCKNWDDVLDWTIKFKENSALYKNEREEVRDRFHRFHDNKNSERVIEAILELGRG